MGALQEFLVMGGYGAFVWPAFAVTLGLMVILAIRSYMAMVQSGRTLDVLEAERPRDRASPTNAAEAE